MRLLRSRPAKVVVTGFGALSGLGIGATENWQKLISGESGVAPIDLFDASAMQTQFAAEVKDFTASDFMPVRDVKKNDRFVLLGIAACQEAIEHAGLLTSNIDKNTIGASIGSGIGGLDSIDKTSQVLATSGVRRVSPFFVPGSIINMIAGNIAIMHGFRGPNISTATACTTGTHAIGVAARSIAYGEAEIMLCGGAEAPVCPLGVAGFNACRALSTRNDAPQKASRPWDVNRDGFVLGEGAGILVLESEASAQKRGATIYAEVCGFGMSGDGFHMTMPHEDGLGAKLAMEMALADAEIDVSMVDYINAHATSTPVGDVVELCAVNALASEQKASVRAAIGGTKSMTGHLLGAAGAIEAIYSVQSIVAQTIPPTINLETLEEVCANYDIPTVKTERQLHYAMSNSFGFGGTNGSLIFGAYK